MTIFLCKKRHHINGGNCQDFSLKTKSNWREKQTFPFTGNHNISLFDTPKNNAAGLSL